MKIAVIENVGDWWQLVFGLTTPVAHILRQQRAEHWMRIHSLPKSKRYATTTSEYEILLSRHNEIATRVLGAQSRCVLFVGQYVENVEDEIHLPEIFPWEKCYFQLYAQPQDHDNSVGDASFDEELLLKIWMVTVEWSPRKFDDIIRQVADDEMRFLLFFSLKTDNAYAPYDGGADLFFGSQQEMLQFKQRYTHWLSNRFDGL